MTGYTPITLTPIIIINIQENMDYKELLEINFGNPSIDLLQKLVDENNGAIAYYKECYKKDKKPYWKGKMGHRAKQNKSFMKHIEEIKKISNGD